LAVGLSSLFLLNLLTLFAVGALYGREVTA
jgi:hypothetical protein